MIDFYNISNLILIKLCDVLHIFLIINVFVGAAVKSQISNFDVDGS